jgi:DNA-binding CsgD family transcriptional regulator/PAS domain-containing protein
MLSNDGFDEIVAGFYRAAQGNIGWVDALWPFAHAVSAIAVHLHAVEPRQGRVHFSHAASLLPAEAEFDYVRTYHRIDPRAGLVIGLAPGQWMHCWEHFDDAFVARDRFYQDFLIPYGSRWVSGVKLLQDDSQCIVLGVHRGLGSAPLDAEDVLLCKRLARHLCDALRLQFGSLKQRQQQMLGLALLDRLRAPVALVDEHRRLLSANPAATRVFALQREVFDIGGRIHCRDADDDAALLVGLLRLLRGDTALPASSNDDRLFLRLHSPHGEPGLGLYLQPLRPMGTLHAFGDQPLAMLLFHQPSLPLELDPFVVAAAYDMTPAEARVAVAAARGAAPDDIARLHGVSTHTVRSQLTSIFRKTGTSRQAELVSQLAALPAATLWHDAGGG